MLAAAGAGPGEEWWYLEKAEYEGMTLKHKEGKGILFYIFKFDLLLIFETVSC